MFLGFTEFKCHKCGKIFEAPALEWNATAYIAPQPCPYCGSRDTCCLNPMDRIFYHVRKFFNNKQ